MKTVNSACIPVEHRPVNAGSTGWRELLARLFRRKSAHYAISEHSPQYLLRDVGIIEGRPPRFSRSRHKLPEWR